MSTYCEGMGALLRFCRDFKWHPLALDHGLALTLLALNLIVPGSRQVGERIPLTPTVVVLSVVAAIALALRRFAPLVVLGVTTAVTTTYLIIEQGKSPIVLFMACAVYTVVMEKDRRTRSTAVVVVALVTLIADAPVSDGNVLDNIGLMLLVLFAGAVGEAVRYRRALQAELEERALRAEQSREEEAQRRVIEERLRIAHELHDVIAHHIALMNVQAGVAAHVLRDQPEEAERALALVRSGGRTVLQELTVLLGVLRRGSLLPTAPAPSLQELGSLIESFAAAGVEVDWQPPAEIDPLPDVIELAAYRIIQESLTNILKHAPGAPAQIRLTHQPGALTIHITNPAPNHPSTSQPPPLTPAAPHHPNGTRPDGSSSPPSRALLGAAFPTPDTSAAQPSATSPTSHPGGDRTSATSSPRPATHADATSSTAPRDTSSAPHAGTTSPTPSTPPRGTSRFTPHAGTSSTAPRDTSSAPHPGGGRSGAGHGLLGMRERVAAVGGELRAGPEPGGGFGVHAVLPFETGVVGDDPGAAGRRPDADPQRVPGAGELSLRSGGRC
ncbi:histidine kinase [Kribbella sp. NPDC023972]|uniref:histidine kinase n=1 Tax=Kribbella sp. NPDC023972 TaxID=3154795 RepID=UPI003403550E